MGVSQCACVCVFVFLYICHFLCTFILHYVFICSYVINDIYFDELILLLTKSKLGCPTGTVQ